MDSAREVFSVMMFCCVKQAEVMERKMLSIASTDDASRSRMFFVMEFPAKTVITAASVTIGSRRTVSCRRSLLRKNRCIIMSGRRLSLHRGSSPPGIPAA